jgi:hypothetical protein
MLSKPINEPNPSLCHGEQENLLDVLVVSLKVIQMSFATCCGLNLVWCVSFSSNFLIGGLFVLRRRHDVLFFIFTSTHDWALLLST